MKKCFFSAVYVVLSITIVTVAAFGVRQPATPVSCWTPSVYTPVLDPGHGGEDGGAVSLSGMVESRINWQITEKIRDTFLLFGTVPVMTRDTEDITYPDSAATTRQRKRADQEARLACIERVENALLISIHQNKYASGAPFGAQVLYAPTTGSDILAQRLQDCFLATINPENRRTAAQISKDIFLMNHVHCPAVLIECGFLSNAREEALLQSSTYQLKLAAAITSACMAFIRDASA